jgi:hypothetical protein
MTTSAASPRQYPGRPLIALGFGLTALGIAAYVVQVSAGRLTVPWYLPVSTTLGLACVAVALWRSRSLWRFLALVPLLLAAVAGWGLAFGGRLPAYTGSRVAAGKPFPEFATARADGSPFTQRDLEGDRDTVMVFFRGRW